MSATFSLSRLEKLMTKQFFENAKFYGFSILALFGLLSIVFTFWITTGKPNFNEEFVYIIFLVALYIAGLVFASMSFTMLTNKDKGVYWLGIPATHAEKLVCAILYTTVLFGAVYCICFFVVKEISVMVIKGMMENNPAISYKEMSDFDRGFGAVIPYFLYGYVALQSFFLLGSVFFTKYTFVITITVGALICFVFGYYLNLLQDGVLGPISWDLVSARQYESGVKGGYLFYTIPSTITEILKYIVQFVWAPLFWIVTWYRLKEKEL